jgi:hypothetical protein
MGRTDLAFVSVAGTGLGLLSDRAVSSKSRISGHYGGSHGRRNSGIEDQFQTRRELDHVANTLSGLDFDTKRKLLSANAARFYSIPV